MIPQGEPSVAGNRPTLLVGDLQPKTQVRGQRQRTRKQITGSPLSAPLPQGLLDRPPRPKPIKKRSRTTVLRERYELRNEAARLLYPQKLPGYRVALCQKYPIPSPSDQDVGIYLSDKHTAFASGLIPCSLVWSCAVCAAKITERRRAELVEALDRAKARGMTVIMQTLTARHSKHDLPLDMCARFLRALRLFHNRKVWRKWAKAAGVAGTVRALEYTVGEAGPHVHLHILLFCEKTPHQTIFNSCGELLPAWIEACIDAGLDEPNEHGLDLTAADRDIAGYVTKWGVDLEMTKAHTKHGRSGGRTPTDLLRASKSGDEEASRQYLAYAHAFHGRRQLVWSGPAKERPGLRELLGLGEEETDDEAANAHDQTASLVGHVRKDNGDLDRMIKYDFLWRILTAVEQCPAGPAEGLRRILIALQITEWRAWAGP